MGVSMTRSARSLGQPVERHDWHDEEGNPQRADRDGDQAASAPRSTREYNRCARSNGSFSAIHNLPNSPLDDLLCEHAPRVATRLPKQRHHASSCGIRPASERPYVREFGRTAEGGRSEEVTRISA